MAAKQAAQPVAAGVQEKSGRFDAIRFDRAFAEVNIPGYDINKAISRRDKQRKRRQELHAPSSGPVAPAGPLPVAVPVEPVVFGLGTAITPGPSPQPSEPTGPGFELEL